MVSDSLPENTQRPGRFARSLFRFLDGLYFFGAVLAAIFLIALLNIIVLQMTVRWSGLIFPGSTEYAGYCMATASFLAFAHAFNRGAHIRVSLLLSALGSYRHYVEIWCFTVASALACYFAWYAVRTVYWSYRLHDISQGQDATPLWIPQLVMAAGTILLAVAIIDHLARLILTRDHGIKMETV